MPKTIKAAVEATCVVHVRESFITLLLQASEWSDGNVSIDVRDGLCRVSAKRILVSLFPGHPAFPVSWTVPANFYISLSLDHIRTIDFSDVGPDDLIDIMSAEFYPRLRMQKAHMPKKPGRIIRVTKVAPVKEAEDEASAESTDEAVDEGALCADGDSVGPDHAEVTNA